ncbi:MAG: TIGR03067 domain-containing protein [Isosphaeraceae bacterium]
MHHAEERRTPLSRSTAALIALACWHAAAAAQLPDESEDSPAVKADVERLQGLWKLESLEVNGKKAPDDQIRSWILVIEGKQYNPGSRETSVEYSFRLDPTLTPKAIDLIPHEGPMKGRSLRGIYSVSDEAFILCRALGSDSERPAGFNTRPESGLVKVVWKRRKP